MTKQKRDTHMQTHTHTYASSQTGKDTNRYIQVSEITPVTGKV